MPEEQLYPTVCFSFAMVKGETVLHQMFVDQWGKVEWKPVPMIELGSKRQPSIAGYVSDEDDA